MSTEGRDIKSMRRLANEADPWWVCGHRWIMSRKQAFRILGSNYVEDEWKAWLNGDIPWPAQGEDVP